MAFSNRDRNLVLIRVRARERAAAIWAAVGHDRVVEAEVFNREVDPMAATSKHTQLVPARRTSVETAAVQFLGR